MPRWRAAWETLPRVSARAWTRMSRSTRSRGRGRLRCRAAGSGLAWEVERAGRSGRWRCRRRGARPVRPDCAAPARCRARCGPGAGARRRGEAQHALAVALGEFRQEVPGQHQHVAVLLAQGRHVDLQHPQAEYRSARNSPCWMWASRFWLVAATMRRSPDARAPSPAGAGGRPPAP